KNKLALAWRKDSNIATIQSYVNEFDMEVLGAYHPFFINQTQYIVVSEIPFVEVNADFFTIFKYASWLILFFTTCLLFIANYKSRGIEVDLEIIAHSAQQLTYGNFDLSPSPSDFLEMDNINQHLNKLSENLKIEGQQKREQDEKFSILFKKNPTPCFIIENDTIIDANQASINSLAYDDIQSISGKTLHQISPQLQEQCTRSKDKIKRMQKIALERGFCEFEWTLQKLDGTVLPVIVQLTKIILNGQPFFIALWNDLSERKDFEKKISELNKRLSGMQETDSSNSPMDQMSVEAMGDDQSKYLSEHQEVEPSQYMSKTKESDPINSMDNMVESEESTTLNDQKEPSQTSPLNQSIRFEFSEADALYRQFQIKPSNWKKSELLYILDTLKAEALLHKDSEIVTSVDCFLHAFDNENYSALVFMRDFLIEKIPKPLEA
ncbi:PAS domain-containing protein, partial [bacterium]|nr:PAS domain-containing protein [bacterium]